MRRNPQPSRSTSGATGADLIKVPAVIIPLFWLIKVITTGLGEATSDLLVRSWGIGLAGAVIIIIASYALAIQIRGEGYRPQTYWFAVTAIAVAATVGSDVFSHYSGGPLEIPIQIVAGSYAVALAISFVAWYLLEGTLSIHSITTRRREIFYWITIALAFALGTAVGDWAAFTVELGLLASIYIFGGVVALAWLGWQVGLINSVLAFWVAYVATRPLGASLADELDGPKPFAQGYGTGLVAGVGLGLVALMVLYLWLTGEDAGPIDEDTWRPAGGDLSRPEDPDRTRRRPTA